MDAVSSNNFLFDHKRTNASKPLAAMEPQKPSKSRFEMVQGDLAESEKSEGTINAEQLVMGVSRLKGAARSVS